MSIAIQINPFDFFTDTHGDALDAGYVWIGEPNKDPRQYPIAVFYDEPATIPAQMPLRTINGYISRNGSPAFIFVSGNCSIMVQDSNQRQIFYVADYLLIGNGQAVSSSDLANSSDPTKGSALSGFIQAGAGAVGRTAQSKMRDIVSVRDFGSVGDGVANDSAAFQAAYDSLPANGGSVYVPPGNYKFSNIIGTKPLNLVGAGAFNGGVTFTNPSTSDPFFSFSNVSGVQLSGFNMTSSVNRTGGAYVVCSNVNRFKMNDFFADKYYMCVDHDGGSEITLDSFQMFNGVADSVVVGSGAIRLGNTAYTASINIDNGYIKCTDGALQCAFGILAKFVDVLSIGGGVTIIQHGNNLQITPENGHTASLIKCNATCIDTAKNGLYIAPAAGGRVLRCDFNGAWFGAHSLNGVVIDATLGSVETINFLGGQAIANAVAGFNILGSLGKNIKIIGVDISTNDIGVRATSNINVSIHYCNFGSLGPSGGNNTGLAFDGTVTGIISDNEFKSNTLPVSGSPSSGLSVFDNKGIVNWTNISSGMISTVGTLGTNSGVMNYRKVLDTVFFEYTGGITTNGTGAGAIQISLPFTVAGAFAGTGRAAGISGKQLQIYANGSVAAVIMNYDGTYPASNGELLVVSGTYQTNP